MHRPRRVGGISPGPMGGGSRGEATHSKLQLIPAPPPYATLLPSVASKRDHDEWLARGRSGGWRVAAVQVESRSARSGSPGKPLATRGAVPCGTVPEDQVATHEAAAETGLGRTSGPPFATDCRVFAMRHGMRPGRLAIRPKPRSAGEAFASLHLRTTRVRPAPRRPRFYPGTSRGPSPSGASARPIPASLGSWLQRAARARHRRRPKQRAG
jgi:hypothetical protein